MVAYLFSGSSPTLDQGTAGSLMFREATSRNTTCPRYSSIFRVMSSPYGRRTFGLVACFFSWMVTKPTEPFPWKAAHQRRSVLYKYTSRSSTRSGQAEVLADPDIYGDECIVGDMTDMQQVVMWGPYSNYHEELTYLSVSAAGEVEAVTCTDSGNIWSDNRG